MDNDYQMVTWRVAFRTQQSPSQASVFSVVSCSLLNSYGLVLPMVRAANWAKHRNADNHNEVFLLADFSKYCSKLNSLTFCFCVNGSVAQTNDAA